MKTEMQNQSKTVCILSGGTSEFCLITLWGPTQPFPLRPLPSVWPCAATMQQAEKQPHYVGKITKF